MKRRPMLRAVPLAARRHVCSTCGAAGHNARSCTTVRDPQTPQEWQEAADVAYFVLALDSARQYGVVTGGPVVNVRRADDLLGRARSLGIRPRPDAVERHVAAWLSPQRRARA